MPQIQAYMLELGPSVESPLLPLLQEPDDVVRARVAEILGAVGGDASRTALQGLKSRERDGDVADAAQHALDRIKLRMG